MSAERHDQLLDTRQGQARQPGGAGTTGRRQQLRREIRGRDLAFHRLAGRQIGAAGYRHIVVVGDSLGAGQGDPVPGLELIGWAERLAVALHSQYPGIRTTNLARSGLTTTEIIRTQLDDAVAMRPDLIVVAAGGNDLMGRAWEPETFRRDYTVLLAQLMAGGTTVLTTTWHNLPLAVPLPPTLARRLSLRLDEASAAVREVSQELGAPCLDFWQMPHLLDAGCYSRDGVHPNARGYLRVAEVIADGLGRHAGMPVPGSALRTRTEHQLGQTAGGQPHAARDLRRNTDRVLGFDPPRQ